MGLILGPTRFVKVPWGDVALSDLREAGPPELTRDTRHIGRSERHMCLHVKGDYVPDLGMVAIRCERHSGWVLPLTLSIVDTAKVQVEIEDDDNGA